MPARDRMIDEMLSSNQEGYTLFPSLGFENEERGMYFIQVTVGAIMVSAWKIINANVSLPDTYSCNVYRLIVYNGIEQWRSTGNDRFVCEDLIQLQAMMHNVFAPIVTPEGNDDDLER